MKKIIFLFIVIFTFCIPVSAEEYRNNYNNSVNYNITPAGIRIKFAKGEGRDNIFCNGRLCVSVEEGVRLMGGSFEQTGFVFKITIEGKTSFFQYSADSNKPYIIIYNERPYINIYDFITPFGYEMTADTEQNCAEIMKYSQQTPTGVRYKRNIRAFIRLEDIVADGMKPDGTGNYTADMLEKLKYTAEYLYNRGYEYYVAWIPVYVYPPDNYKNDVSREYNLYNSYFLYVMDFMKDHGGHIGLHGYTHQYGNDESGNGYEWGKNTPYTLQEQQMRMIESKLFCTRLGYNAEFFEFPHYAATEEQKKMAEEYFDVIYQSYGSNNNIVCKEKDGRKIYYIPTPAEYVRFKRDYSIYDKIDRCIENNYAVSFYFHPVLDKDKIAIENINGSRVWKYIEEAMLPEIISYADGKGCYFSAFDK